MSDNGKQEERRVASGGPGDIGFDPTDPDESIGYVITTEPCEQCGASYGQAHVRERCTDADWITYLLEAGSRVVAAWDDDEPDLDDAIELLRSAVAP